MKHILVGVFTSLLLTSLDINADSTTQSNPLVSRGG